MRRSALIAAVMTVVFFLFGHRATAAVAGSIGSLVLVLSFLLADEGVAGFERFIARGARWVGVAVGVVLLVPVFFLVMTPLGLGRRLLGSDALAQRTDRAATTFWTRRPGRPVRADRPF